MSHKKPITRRDFLGQGIGAAASYIFLPSIYTLLATKRAYGDSSCLAPAASTLPAFICLDLAGGGNIAGSNVIVGKQGGQTNFLSAYDKLGLPPSMYPSVSGMVDTSLGLAFHAQSAMLAGIKSVATASTMAAVDGFVMAAQSMDDSSSNPHNPAYLVAQSGLTGTMMAQIGAQANASGGNSTSPDFSINPAMRPVTVTNPTSAKNLVALNVLSSKFSSTQVSGILSAIQNMSSSQLNNFQASDISTQVKSLFGCQVQAAANATQMGATLVDPSVDASVTSVFGSLTGASSTDLQVATIAKLVLDNYAGAGTIEMGGFDYHSGNRTDGETKDQAAGRAIGQILQLAALKKRSVMIYVFTDGGITSNQTPDAGANGKYGWQGDAGQFGASFVLAYNAKGVRPTITQSGRQIGYFNDPGQGVVTTSSLIANNVPNLAMAVALNYMALAGNQGNFANVVANTTNPFVGIQDSYTMLSKV